MIEPTSLLNQLELLVQKAKQNPTEANVREQLTAVRALCDVLLQSDNLSMASFMNASDISAPIQSSAAAPQRAMPKRADVEQQNDSIFDF